MLLHVVTFSNVIGNIVMCIFSLVGKKSGNLKRKAEKGTLIYVSWSLVSMCIVSKVFSVSR